MNKWEKDKTTGMEKDETTRAGYFLLHDETEREQPLKTLMSLIPEGMY